MLDWLSILHEPWWQGLGGMAQIVAGFFALYTIMQAGQMMRDAKKERQDSVAPAWGIVSVGTVEDGRITPVRKNVATFDNVGRGPAYLLDMRFESTNGNEFTNYPLTGSQNVVGADGVVSFTLDWNDTQPPEGRLVLAATSSVGQRVVHRFQLRTVERGGRLVPEITPILNMEERMSTRMATIANNIPVIGIGLILLVAFAIAFAVGYGVGYNTERPVVEERLIEVLGPGKIARINDDYLSKGWSLKSVETTKIGDLDLSVYHLLRRR